MSRYIVIIGYPLKHSVSPVLQQAALDYYHLDIRYESRETKAEDLNFMIEQLRGPQSLGANITVPYKEKVLRLLDDIDEQAGLIGAVNTIVNRNGRLVGFNTDAHGFLTALQKDVKFDFTGKQAVLLGAGGVARAAGFALVGTGISSLIITNRTLARAEVLADSLSSYVRGSKLQMDVTTSAWHSVEFSKQLNKSQLIINCTSMGMKHSAYEAQSPLTLKDIPTDALVYDLVYNPPETPLLRLAREAGAQVLGGLPMLVYQGAAGFELWVSEKAPVDIMYKAAKTALYESTWEFMK